MSYWDGCARCGRKRVALVYVVQGVRYRFVYRNGGVCGEPTSGQVLREGPHAEYLAAVPLERRRGRGQCLLTAECDAIVAKRDAKQRTRGKLPEDAELRELHKAERGRCKWCGEPVYRVNKNGHVVVDLRRMWHLGRVVHPDAEPEPDCLSEYNAQAFSFRDQVFHRDHGVCASCGRDCKAEHEAWEAQRPGKRWDAEDAEDWYSRPFEERDAEHRAWVALEPEGWEADHVVPLEDGGEHTLANAQTLCKGCHVLKTAGENSARARRRAAA